MVQFEGKFYVDHNVPFGLASASGLQGEVADAIVDIWHTLGVGPFIKWVDDFNGFCYPSESGSFCNLSDGVLYQYDYDLESMKAMIGPLGVPWHSSKGSPFGDTFAYVGFEWNIPRKSVSLSPTKREKHLSKIIAFLQLTSSSQFFKKDVQSLHGSLSHISFVYQNGKAYLNNIITWLSNFPNEFSPRWTPHSVITDLTWWQDTLSSPSTTRSLYPRPTTTDIGIWVDASTDWGVGILYNGMWDAWRTYPSWKAPGRDIGWLEGVAVELVILILRAAGITDQDIFIRSDNMGVIGAFEKGWSHNQETNYCIRRSNVVLEEARLSISLSYVESSCNLADPISRGILPSLNSRILIPYSLPHHISHLFYHA